MPDSTNIGAGTTIAHGTVLGTYGTPIAKITGHTPPKKKIGNVDNDTFDATLVNGLPVEDVLPGWITPGTWGFKLKSRKSIVTALEAIYGTVLFWKIVLPDLSGYTFQGFVSEIGPEIPMKQAVEQIVTIQIMNGTVATFADPVS